MKNFAFPLLAVALIACSESEKIADVDNGDVVAIEESSSSMDESSSVTGEALSSSVGESSGSKENVSSSSSVTAVLSSGNETQTSSSSYYLDFLDIGAPGSGGGCGAAFSAVAASDGGGGFRPSDQPLPGNYIYPYRLIVEGRTAKLVSEGVPAEEAEKTAKRESKMR